jgi:hypothetical protein
VRARSLLWPAILKKPVMPHIVLSQIEMVEFSVRKIGKAQRRKPLVKKYSLRKNHF